MKTYLVQTWSKEGALTNNYETLIDSTVELKALQKFLKSKHGHVVLTEKKHVPTKGRK